jgi:hypothetical protein
MTLLRQTLIQIEDRSKKCVQVRGRESKPQSWLSASHKCSDQILPPPPMFAIVFDLGCWKLMSSDDWKVSCSRMDNVSEWGDIDHLWWRSRCHLWSHLHHRFKSGLSPIYHYQRNPSSLSEEWCNLPFFVANGCSFSPPSRIGLFSIRKMRECHNLGELEPCSFRWDWTYFAYCAR